MAWLGAGSNCRLLGLHASTLPTELPNRRLMLSVKRRFSKRFFGEEFHPNTYPLSIRSSLLSGGVVSDQGFALSASIDSIFFIVWWVDCISMSM